MAKAKLTERSTNRPATATRQAILARFSAAEIIREFWAGRSEKTRRAYEADLKTLRRYLAAPSAGDALAVVLRAGPGGAFRIANGYKTSLVEAGLAAATINRRLSSLRALVKFARASGLVNWSLEVENVKPERRRDSRGPGIAGVQALLAEVARGNGKKAVRDRALLRVLYDLGLRRAETSQLDVADVDLDAEIINVKGKGRREKERLSLPKPTAEVLRAWMAVRGDGGGALFTSFDRSGAGGRLSPGGIYYLIRRYAARAGVRATPHGLRHAAGTTVAEKTGDVFAVAAFLRHKDLATARAYVDNLDDKAGDAARIVAASVR